MAGQDEAIDDRRRRRRAVAGLGPLCYNAGTGNVLRPGTLSQERSDGQHSPGHRRGVTYYTNHSEKYSSTPGRDLPCPSGHGSGSLSI